MDRTTWGSATGDKDASPVSGVGDNLYQRLKSDIIFGRLPPSDRLRLESLRERYEASASTIREVLNRLTAEGLVLAEGQRGFQVMPVSVSELRDIASLRLLLEKHALEQSFKSGDLEWEGTVLAAHHKLAHVENLITQKKSTKADIWQRYDWEFHHALTAACNSKALMTAFASVYEKYLRYLMVALVFRDEITAGEHRELFDCAMRRDFNNAQEILSRHVTGCVEHAIRTGRLEDDP